MRKCSGIVEGYTKCKAMEDMIKDEKKLASVRMLKSKKLTLEEIAEFLELSLPVIEELEKEQQEK